MVSLTKWLLSCHLPWYVRKMFLFSECLHIQLDQVFDHFTIHSWISSMQRGLYKLLHNSSNIICELIHGLRTPSEEIVSKSVSKGWKSTPTSKFLGMAEAYFVCQFCPNFQIYLGVCSLWINSRQNISNSNSMSIGIWIKTRT